MSVSPHGFSLGEVTPHFRYFFLMKTTARQTSSFSEFPDTLSPFIRTPGQSAPSAGGAIEPWQDRSNLRPDDFRTIYGMLEECRHRWSDPDAWQKHLATATSRLMGVPFALVVEVEKGRSSRAPRIIHGTAHRCETFGSFPGCPLCTFGGRFWTNPCPEVTWRIFEQSVGGSLGRFLETPGVARHRRRR